MDVHIIPIVNDYLSKNEIVISDNTDVPTLVEQLAKHFDALIYNIVSLAALIASIEDQTKIEPKHLVAAQAYIAYKCVGSSVAKKIIGGSKTITLEELNKLEIPKLDDESESHIHSHKLRADMDLRDFVHHVIKYHNINIGKGAMKGILKILHEHLECLLNNIKKNEPISNKKLENIMSMRRYSVFN